MDAGRLTVKRLVALLGPVGLLAACGDQAPAAGPEATATEIPSELRQAARPPAAAEGEVAIGTPMQDRVAVIGLLNKRNNLSQDIELKPGETRRIGNVIVRVQACERTAPWEMPRETGAFVQVFVQDRGTSEFKSRFSGWLFNNSPSLNVVEHPIYDVWVKDCKMSFPGEDEAAASEKSSGNGATGDAPAPRPSPSATPAPTPPAETNAET